MNKFYADSMLGKLSRFLRFFGYDTLYRTSESIGEMLATSSKEKRIVLSQSKDVIRVCKKNNIKSLQVPTTTIQDQLKLLKKELALDFSIPPKTMLCSICNGKLDKKDKEELLDQIPKGTAKFYTDFWQCKNCGKVFWMGSHWEDIKRIITEIS
ncbi:MAG: Mut7-C RNAse domain-containing protein [Candidatus Heimdallarchaeaceae archaeon]